MQLDSQLDTIKNFMDRYNIVATNPRVAYVGMVKAIACNSALVLKYFVEEKGLRLHFVWAQNKTFVHVALRYRAYYCLAYLLHRGVPLPANQDPPLVAVVRQGQFGVIDKILREGYCNVNQPGRGGETALDVAIRRKQWRVAAKLVSVGCKVATWPATGDAAPYPTVKQCPSLVLRQLLWSPHVKRFLLMAYAMAMAPGPCTGISKKQARLGAPGVPRVVLRPTTEAWKNVLGRLVGADGNGGIASELFVHVMKYL